MKEAIAINIIPISPTKVLCLALTLATPPPVHLTHLQHHPCEVRALHLRHRDLGQIPLKHRLRRQAEAFAGAHTARPPGTLSRRGLCGSGGRRTKA